MSLSLLLRFLCRSLRLFKSFFTFSTTSIRGFNRQNTTALFWCWFCPYHFYTFSPAPEFKPGDKVWLDSSDITMIRPSHKLAHRRLGPYIVEQKVRPASYKLKLPPSMSRLHNGFPVVKLTPFNEDEIPGCWLLGRSLVFRVQSQSHSSTLLQESTWSRMLTSVQGWNSRSIGESPKDKVYSSRTSWRATVQG